MKTYTLQSKDDTKRVEFAVNNNYVYINKYKWQMMWTMTARQKYAIDEARSHYNIYKQAYHYKAI